MAKKPAAPAATPTAPPDEHAGKGGCYVINPETGQRELVSRTLTKQEAEAAAAVQTSAPAPANATETEE